MRELKFRAYNKNSKEFIYSDWKYGVVSFWEELQQDYTNEYEPVQQYTGLKDKNRKDIYEGDILNIQLPIGGFWGNTPNRKTAKVKYEPELGGYIAQWDWSKNQHHTSIDCDLVFDAEIIGNIFQNPELIQQPIKP